MSYSIDQQLTLIETGQHVLSSESSPSTSSGSNKLLVAFMECSKLGCVTNLNALARYVAQDEKENEHICERASGQETVRDRHHDTKALWSAFWLGVLTYGVVTLLLFMHLYYAYCLHVRFSLWDGQVPSPAWSDWRNPVLMQGDNWRHMEWILSGCPHRRVSSILQNNKISISLAHWSFFFFFFFFFSFSDFHGLSYGTLPYNFQKIHFSISVTAATWLKHENLLQSLTKR